MTSLMLALSVSSITRRSMPSPIPAVGGIPYSRAVTKSSSRATCSMQTSLQKLTSEVTSCLDSWVLMCWGPGTECTRVWHNAQTRSIRQLVLCATPGTEQMNRPRHDSCIPWCPSQLMHSGSCNQVNSHKGPLSTPQAVLPLHPHAAVGLSWDINVFNLAASRPPNNLRVVVPALQLQPTS